MRVRPDGQHFYWASHNNVSSWDTLPSGYSDANRVGLWRFQEVKVWEQLDQEGTCMVLIGVIFDI